MSHKILMANLIILFIICVFFCQSCSKNESITTIENLAYDGRHNSNDSTLIYVLENGQYVPFIVLTNDYNGNTLLLRKDVLPLSMRINSYSSLYKDSEIDQFLNSDYLSGLDEMQSLVVSSKILITDEESLGVCGNTTEEIERKVFLLSYSEVGFNDAITCGLEGKSLKYFNDSKNKIAFRNGTPSSWWLRTPNTWYLSCTHVIGTSGQLDITNAFDNNGIRPAFCVDSSSQIELSKEVIPEQHVYVFSSSDAPTHDFVGRGF